MVQRSRFVVLFPQISEFLICSKLSANSVKTGRNLLNIEAGGDPSEDQVVSPIIPDLHDDLSLDFFVVPDGEVEVCNVSPSIEVSLIAGYLIS